MAETTSLLERVRNGAWLNDQVFPPLQWVVPGLVAEGFGLVVGPPKLGKSWFVLGLALSAACGAVPSVRSMFPPGQSFTRHWRTATAACRTAPGN